MTVDQVVLPVVMVYPSRLQRKAAQVSALDH
jgi:hypothetical protein